MDPTSLEKQKIVITFSPDELNFLCNAVNETLEAIEEWEFPIRTGETQQRARNILDQLRKSLDEAGH
jgi:hypothetical protein